MKTLTRLLLMGGVMTAGMAAWAQETSEAVRLQQQLEELQENFQRMQQLQREQIEALQRQIEALQRQQDSNAVVTAGPATAAVAVPTPGWQPSDPVRVGKGSAYMDLGLVATFAAGGSTASDISEVEPGGHDPNQQGFSVQGVETSFSGAVDPYFRANVNLLFGLDADNEAYLELEEAWAETVSLPANLQLRAGQFMTDFGRINIQHPHAWGFVDVPLVSARLLGPDGLRNPGARVSWLAPTPFYSEVFLAVQDSQGETASSFRSDGGHTHGGNDDDAVPFGYRHADNDRGMNGVADLLFTPRWASSFDLTDNQTVLAGVSAAFGPNASGGSGDTRTEIYGADLTWKWKSPRHQRGFPFVAWQSEVMFRRYDLGAFDWSGEPADELLVLEPDGVTPAALGGETIKDWGFYSQLLWGFKPGWVAGLRFDYVGEVEASYESAGLIAQYTDGSQEVLGRDPARDERWRISPNLTWYPSEYSKVRLQYNYDDQHGFGVDHSVWLQFEFLLGAHAAHRF